ncbi:hypothetical protein MF271_19550 (plasmid) [Deinococcus sp. KNUC1210]|uniref:hypothetical protein n=1 Tax=Deinococcus sp. KNUC1210 TaxID=2917691 RepID=UPI001EF058CB|nr:hypothetical protein [Deinococcus sp. KNUC1210]ULH17388.1 hypothetical protein MF271_19550 [Deinococcus sp. KNUC1210]
MSKKRLPFPNTLMFTCESISDGDGSRDVFAIKDLWQGGQPDSDEDMKTPSEVLIAFDTPAQVRAFCRRQRVEPAFDEDAQEAVDNWVDEERS